MFPTRMDGSPLTRVEAMRRQCGSTPTSPWEGGGTQGGPLAQEGGGTPTSPLGPPDAPPGAQPPRGDTEQGSDPG